MSRYNVIKTATDAYIKRNGRREITGPILNSVLNAIIDSLGKFYQFVGVATPSTNPGSPDQNVAFVAATAGTYANMGGVVLASGEMAVIKWDGTWVKETILILPEESESNVFIATYGETHIADITAAYNAGKLVIVNNGQQTFFPALMDGDAEEYYFFAFDEVGDYYYFFINDNAGWSRIQNESLVKWSSIIQSWPDRPANWQIPTAKLVYDSVAERYILPQDGIPAEDLSSDVQDSLSKANTALQSDELADHAVVFDDQQSLSNSEKAQARANIGAGTSDFSGDYNDLTNKPTIPAAQVQSDWDEADNTEPSFIRNKPSIPTVPDISTDIVADRASDTKTASPKAVFDALGKMGVIRQTQTWSGSGNNPRTYVMSNLVMGLIPQAFIDLAQSAGATFNLATGYFELNGLTDLSYEEMKAIFIYGGIPYHAEYSFYYNMLLRTNLPLKRISINLGTGWFARDSSLETICLNEGRAIAITNATYFIYYSHYLRKVIGVIDVSSANGMSSTPFNYCASLESIEIKGIKDNVSFNASSKLTAASVAYMITNAGTATITITLHATAYARATADPAVQAALAAHTNVTLASA